MFLHQKFYGSPGIGTLLDFIEENQSFTFNKWSKSHCRQIGYNGLCVKISVKCLLGEGKFDKINLHKVIVISLSKFSY